MWCEDNSEGGERKIRVLGDQTISDIFQTKEAGKLEALFRRAWDDGNIHLSLLAFFGSSMTSRMK